MAKERFHCLIYKIIQNSFSFLSRKRIYTVVEMFTYKNGCCCKHLHTETFYFQGFSKSKRSQK